jgi:hypothetical protein
LGSGCILECSLLYLLAESFDLLFHFDLEVIPRAFQLAFGAQPGCLASICLLLGGLQKFVAFFCADPRSIGRP